MKTLSTSDTDNTSTPVPLNTVSAEIEIDLRIWDPEIIKRVLMMLDNQVLHVEADADLFPKTVLKLKFLSPGLDVEEITDFFFAKLISAKATVDHSKRSQEIREDFVKTAIHVTTEVRNQIESFSKTE